MTSSRPAPAVGPLSIEARVRAARGGSPAPFHTYRVVVEHFVPAESLSDALAEAHRTLPGTVIAVALVPPVTP